MELYLWRHGIAEARSPSGLDRDRRLTDRGQAEVRRLARRIAVLGVAPSVMLASPYVRARETAEIAAEVLGYEGRIERAACLTPDSPPTAAWDEIRRHADAASVFVVGHEPLLSATAAFLVGATEVVAKFAPATVARLDVEDVSPRPKATLRFLIGSSDA
jgi:phosphohistidine phosphatase